MVNEEKQKAHKAEVYCYIEAEVPRTLSNQFSYHYFQFNFPRRHSPSHSLMQHMCEVNLNFHHSSVKSVNILSISAQFNQN